MGFVFLEIWGFGLCFFGDLRLWALFLGFWGGLWRPGASRVQTSWSKDLLGFGGFALSRVLETEVQGLGF